MAIVRRIVVANKKIFYRPNYVPYGLVPAPGTNPYALSEDSPLLQLTYEDLGILPAGQQILSKFDIALMGTTMDHESCTFKGRLAAIFVVPTMRSRQAIVHELAHVMYPKLPFRKEYEKLLEGLNLHDQQFFDYSHDIQSWKEEHWAMLCEFAGFGTSVRGLQVDDGIEYVRRIFKVKHTLNKKAERFEFSRRGPLSPACQMYIFSRTGGPEEMYLEDPAYYHKKMKELCTLKQVQDYAASWNKWRDEFLKGKKMPEFKYTE